MESGIHIRDARVEDAEALAVIYNYEVHHGTNHYESEPQLAADRAKWIEGLQARRFPVYVAEKDGEVIGFAALTPFHPLSGYRFTVSGSLYVKIGFRGAGVGRLLCEALVVGAHQQGYHCVLAGVNSENAASLSLLKSFGFQEAGRFREIGTKDGRWHDDICLQKIF